MFQLKNEIGTLEGYPVANGIDFCYRPNDVVDVTIVALNQAGIAELLMHYRSVDSAQVVCQERVLNRSEEHRYLEPGGAFIGIGRDHEENLYLLWYHPHVDIRSFTLTDDDRQGLYQLLEP